VPYGGYHRRVVPPEDAELTHVGPGTPCGEYMRRFWWPVCLWEQIGDLPHAIRILGENLVAFRDKSNRVGVLHRHCSHPGTSLEYGIPSERGLRCCYHGWLFDVDGRILETPGEPPESRLRNNFVHGAYPALEYHGLVFAYLGPPRGKPDFPVLDTFEEPNTQIKPYSIWHPCNYLQVMDNLPDFFHTCILHNGIGNAALARGEAETDMKVDMPFEVFPVTEFRPIDEGNGYLYGNAASRPDDLDPQQPHDLPDLHPEHRPLRGGDGGEVFPAHGADQMAGPERRHEMLFQSPRGITNSRESRQTT
jgi:nitrite reductase/ring-hydroxylating ferredoxin subunit